MCDMCGNPECKAEPWTEDEKKMGEDILDFVNKATTRQDAVNRIAHLCQLTGSVIGSVPPSIQVVSMALLVDAIEASSQRRYGKSAVKMVGSADELAQAISEDSKEAEDKKTVH